MAVEATLYKKKMKLSLNKGVNPETNKTIQGNLTYSDVNSTATNDNIYDVATNISTLQKNTVTSILKIEESELISE